jgi:hypothetical protein
MAYAQNLSLHHVHFLSYMISGVNNILRAHTHDPTFDKIPIHISIHMWLLWIAIPHVLRTSYGGTLNGL